MERLSTELLRVILDHINQDPEAVLTIDRRAHLSVESFKAAGPPEPAKAQDIGQFRQVCRRFAEIGIPYQFMCVALRFNKRSFERLERIARCPHLAEHVKKFIYLIPYFYVEGSIGVNGRLPDIPVADPLVYIRKFRDQRELIESGYDTRVLKMAMAAFTSLQLVQLQPVQDELEGKLLDYIRETDHFGDEYLDLKWSPACLHGSRTLAQALIESQSKFTVFSGLSMSPQSVTALKAHPSKSLSTTISSLASQLTCLELHFNDGADRGWHVTTIDDKIRELSGLFRDIFTAATNMRSVHVGFRTRAPLGLPLEAIFHNVTWSNLRAFGIQSWFLDAEEIVQLATRHRRTLRGLRLRDVQLKKGSMWKDVLVKLRNEMDILDWLSLRRIGYEDWFNSQIRNTMEVPPEPMGGNDSDNEGHLDIDDWYSSTSDSDDSHADHNDNTNLNTATHAVTNNLQHVVIEEEDEDDQDSDDSHEDHDDGPDDDDNGHGMGPDTPSSVPWCNCTRTLGTPDDLGDNGYIVSVQQRKLWEQWVVGRCVEHSSSRPLPR